MIKGGFSMVCDSQFITKRTLAIVPTFENQYRSQIITLDDIQFSTMSAFNLINNACIRYGSTMDGRANAVKALLSFTQKTPFIIAPFDISVFPTISAKHPECIYIFNHHFQIKELEKGKSRLTFFNGTRIDIPCSKYALHKQQLRLHSLLDTYRRNHKQDSDFGNN